MINENKNRTNLTLLVDELKDNIQNYSTNGEEIGVLVAKSDNHNLVNYQSSGELLEGKQDSVVALENNIYVAILPKSNLKTAEKKAKQVIDRTNDEGIYIGVSSVVPAFVKNENSGKYIAFNLLSQAHTALEECLFSNNRNIKIKQYDHNNKYTDLTLTTTTKNGKKFYLQKEDVAKLHSSWNNKETYSRPMVLNDTRNKS